LLRCRLVFIRSDSTGAYEESQLRSPKASVSSFHNIQPFTDARQSLALIDVFSIVTFSGRSDRANPMPFTMLDFYPFSVSGGVILGNYDLPIGCQRCATSDGYGRY
jgi:hypothetical protein